jgi:GntR family transcriptional regulator
MSFTIDPHSGVPVYRQLMDQIRFQVASGVLRAGDELPSTRQLSADLRVNPMTVSKAYGYLEQAGLVERPRGQAMRVRERDTQAQASVVDEELRKSLRPAVRAVRQLGVSKAAALREFERLLEADEAD